MLYLIALTLLNCSLILPSAFRPERTTISHTSQTNATRMREGTKQMREGLKHAVQQTSTPSSQMTPRSTNPEIKQLLTITKKPIHHGPRK